VEGNAEPGARVSFSDQSPDGFKVPLAAPKDGAAVQAGKQQKEKGKTEDQGREARKKMMEEKQKNLFILN
jgi:hypothetical protein